jgi:hypothetical protein
MEGELCYLCLRNGTESTIGGGWTRTKEALAESVTCCLSNVHNWRDRRDSRRLAQNSKKYSAPAALQAVRGLMRWSAAE